MTLPVTLTDIAKVTKVNPATVSYVLNGKADKVGIAKATQKRILEAAKELKYRPSPAARALVTGKTHTIGIMGGDVRNPHYAELASEFIHESAKLDYHVAFSLSEWQEPGTRPARLDSLLNRGVDGIVVLETSSILAAKEEYLEIQRDNLPLVTLNHALKGVPNVQSDWGNGLEETVLYLKSMGHTRVGLIRFTTSSLKSSKRVAFLASCEKHNIQPVDYVVSQHPDVARKDAEKMALNGDLPSALIVWSDQVAMAICAGLRDAGLVIPREVSIVGIDGTQASAYYYPALTSIVQDRYELAKSILGLLMDQINGKSIDKPKEIQIPTKLIIRDSVHLLKNSENSE